MHKNHNDPLLELIDQVYEAGLDTHRWHDVLCRAARLFDSDAVILFTPREGLQQRYLYCDIGFDPGPMQEYQEHYYQHDAWTVAAAEKGWMSRGTVKHSEELIALPDLRRTAFYSDMLRRVELESGLFAIVADETSSPLLPRTHFSVFRRPGREGFDGDAAALMRVLVPHLYRAVEVHWRLRHAEVNVQSMGLGLDPEAQGLLLLGPNAEVLYLTPLADTLMKEAELRLRYNRLTGSTPAAADAVARMVDAALKRRPANERLASASGRTIRCEFTPLPEAHPLRRHFGNPAVLVVLEREQRPAVGTFGALAQRFHLTQAETHVLEKLVDGVGPRQIAEDAAISERTVRTQLSSIYRKTATRNQRELLHLAVAARP